MRPVLSAAVIGMVVLAAGFAWSAAGWRTGAELVRRDPETALSNPMLHAFAHRMGEGVFAERCAGCHGAEGRGDPARGVPNLTDHDHLYALDDVAAVEAVVRHGIRAGDARGWNLASMPAFAAAQPYKGEALPSLTPSQVEDVTQFVLALGDRATDAAAAHRGAGLFGDQAACWDCHGHSAQGDTSIGAPDLTDNVWLYGHGSHDDIRRALEHGHAGVCPAFAHVLSPAQSRAVAVYAYELGHPNATAGKAQHAG